MVLHNCSYSSKSMVLTKKKGRFYDLGRKALGSNAEMGDLSKTAMAHVLLPTVDTSLRKERWFRKYCSYTMLHHCNRTWQWRIPCWFRGDFPIKIGFIDFFPGIVHCHELPHQHQLIQDMQEEGGEFSYTKAAKEMNDQKLEEGRWLSCPWKDPFGVELSWNWGGNVSPLGNSFITWSW